MNSMMVTVLMPVYNAGPYVREAIDSVLSQTYRDFEFLIINDGSKDNSLEIIQSFNDSRIRVIDQPNKGLITTLNEGMAIAKGDIIARMDADDVCLPERLEHQMDFLHKHTEYVLVGSEASVMDKEGNYLYELEPVGFTHEEIAVNINNKCPFIHPAVTFYKDAVLKVGGYPKDALTFEDHLLWKELLSTGKVCNLREVLIKVRFNPESVTIDEKWRGKEFIDIRQRSIMNGSVSEEDGRRLKELIASQNFSAYKQASYYAMVGKKYLWNNPDKKRAREHFIKAIKLYPGNKEVYLLLLMSYLPSALVTHFYNRIKGIKK
jgi:glycosyltransferase involved in cell wall biosynthesis